MTDIRQLRDEWLAHVVMDGGSPNKVTDFHVRLLLALESYVGVDTYSDEPQPWDGVLRAWERLSSSNAGEEELRDLEDDFNDEVRLMLSRTAEERARRTAPPRYLAR